MSLEIAAIALTVVVHFAGAGVLVWALLDGQDVDWRTFWPRDDDDRRGPEVPGGEPGPAGGALLALPLPDAGPSSARLREPGRIAEAHPRPARRPEHPPAPRPGVPERS